MHAMPYPAAPTRRIPSLTSAAQRQAWMFLFGSAGALVIGAVMLGLGFIIGITFCIAIPLLIGGLIGLPYGMFLLYDPTHGGSLGRLGRSRAERLAALRQVEMELADPSTGWIDIDDGTAFLCRNWFVVARSSALHVVPSAQITWVSIKWRKRDRHLAYTLSHSSAVYEIALHDGDPDLAALLWPYLPAAQAQVVQTF